MNEREVRIINREKIYKDYYNNNSMILGDLKRSQDESFLKKFNSTLVFIDDGFLAKLSKYFERGKYLK